MQTILVFGDRLANFLRYQDKTFDAFRTLVLGGVFQTIIDFLDFLANIRITE